MMFDVPLFLLVSVSAVGAITFAVPGQVRGLVGRRNDITVPIHLVMAGAAIQQSLIAVGLAAAGTAAAPRSGLGAPWFEAVSSGYGLGWREMVLQLPAALAVGGASSVVFLVLYYRVFRPRMVAGDAQRIEEFRTSMGPMGRVLMGGVAEEVMFRWGVMSVLAWISIVALGLPEGLGMWLAIVVAGLLFGLAHLPSVMAVGVKLSRPIVGGAIALNMVVALASGWLFWQYGLLSAMVAHGLLHVVWQRLEKVLGAA